MNTELDITSVSYVTHFLRDTLAPWCNIEGAELGDSQEKLIAAMGYDDEINFGLMLLLDKSVRSMIDAIWFQEMLKEEQEPHDYYASGMRDARDAFARAKHNALASCKRYWQYGGEEAAAWIEAYKPI